MALSMIARCECYMDKLSFRMSVRSSDPNLASQIAEIKIEGVTVTRLLPIKEIINPPVDFIFGVSVTLSVNVAAQLIGRKLWGIIKSKKEAELKIGGQQIQTDNLRTIEQKIIYVLNEDKDE
jgi:hypothetical protein